MPARSCSSSGSRSPLSLLSKLFAVAVFLAGMASACWAQDKVEIYGGYSYFRASVREGQFNPCVTVCPNSTFFTSHANLNGWELSGHYKLLPFLGAVANFNGTYGSVDVADIREHTFLIGPQLQVAFSLALPAGYS